MWCSTFLRMLWHASSVCNLIMTTNLKVFKKFLWNEKQLSKTIKFFHHMPVCPCLVHVFQPLVWRHTHQNAQTLTSFQDFSFLTLATVLWQCQKKTDNFLWNKKFRAEGCMPRNVYGYTFFGVQIYIKALRENEEKISFWKNFWLKVLISRIFRTVRTVNWAPFLIMAPGLYSRTPW